LREQLLKDAAVQAAREEEETTSWVAGDTKAENDELGKKAGEEWTLTPEEEHQAYSIELRWMLVKGLTEGHIDVELKASDLLTLGDHEMEKEIDQLRQERMSATAEVVCARGLVETAARDISVAVASKISMRNELILALLEHSVASGQLKASEEARTKMEAEIDHKRHSLASATVSEATANHRRTQAEAKAASLEASLEASRGAQLATDERAATAEKELELLRTHLREEMNMKGQRLGSTASLMEALRCQMEKMRKKHSQGLVESANRVRALEMQAHENEMQRRDLNNQLHELKGNVRVFARLRPFLPSDGCALPDAAPSIEVRDDGESLSIKRIARGTRGGAAPAETFNFRFDKVYEPRATQEEVFEGVSEFVQSSLDGYQVCLFSYGQTGSGKTHTMQGAGSEGGDRGLIPRCIEQIGRAKVAMEDKGWVYKMEVTFIEIYNEEIRDLLRGVSGKAKGGEKSASRGDLLRKVGSSEKLSHEIKTSRDGTLYITDVTRQAVNPTDTASIEALLRLAAQRRSVSAEEMNAQVMTRAYRARASSPVATCQYNTTSENRPISITVFKVPCDLHFVPERHQRKA